MSVPVRPVNLREVMALNHERVADIFVAHIGGAAGLFQSAALTMYTPS